MRLPKYMYPTQEIDGLPSPKWFSSAYSLVQLC